MKWRVIINRSYIEMSFIFDTLEDAGAFLMEFVRAKEPDEDDEKYKWRYISLGSFRNNIRFNFRCRNSRWIC